MSGHLHLGGVTRKGPQWPESLSFFWYDTDYVYFFILKSRCHIKRWMGGARMTPTQDIRDLFARCSPFMERKLDMA